MTMIPRHSGVQKVPKIMEIDFKYLEELWRILRRAKQYG
jgi:hypothetical protein